MEVEHEQEVPTLAHDDLVAVVLAAHPVSGQGGVWFEGMCLPGGWLGGYICIIHTPPATRRALTQGPRHSSSSGLLRMWYHVRVHGAVRAHLQAIKYAALHARIHICMQ